MEIDKFTYLVGCALTAIKGSGRGKGKSDLQVVDEAFTLAELVQEKLRDREQNIELEAAAFQAEFLEEFGKPPASLNERTTNSSYSN